MFFVQELEIIITNILLASIRAKQKDGFSGYEGFLYVQNLVKMHPGIHHFISMLSAELLSLNLAQKSASTVKKHLNSIESLAEFINFIEGKIESASSELASDVQFDCTQERLHNEIDELMDKLFGVDDHRHQNDGVLSIRRMDSLARLFSLPLSLSVCAASAFHQGKIIISANMSQPDDQQKIIFIITARLALMHEFIKSFPENLHDNYDDFKTLTDLCADKMKAIGGISLPGDVFNTAFSKFAHAMICDKETFSEEIRLMWKQEQLNFTILLPVSAQDKKITFMAYSQESSTEEVLPIPEFKGLVSVKSVHAEQLLAKYVLGRMDEQQYTSEQPLQIGVLKLCCKSCENNLKLLPVMLRGGHGHLYRDTLNFFGLEAPLTPPRQGRSSITAALNSNPKSIQAKMRTDKTERNLLHDFDLSDKDLIFELSDSDSDHDSSLSMR
ncbi:hypothetical protein [Legionella shakespearei]|uniref:Uncharacterized protein n=1 Tax=Legionella shakespearei DSM 23087 TaxID=1122169 RepID=A0A0W0YVR4_9GAMM|nr:hypothetical protein [Legionella shakespearei]KTD60946.1 hypothetical protein Lsha_1357 [Legionella shakespearei DSM 23087]